MSEMPGIETTTIEVTLEEIVGDLEIPCDYSVRSWCSKQHAEWAAFLTPCSCGAAGERLLCSPCKDVVIQTPDGLVCRDCGEVTIPARHAFHSFEALQ